MKNVSGKKARQKRNNMDRPAGNSMKPLRAVCRFAATLLRRICRSQPSLHQLSDHELKDIGMTRDQLYGGSRRPMVDRCHNATQARLRDQQHHVVRRLPQD